MLLGDFLSLNNLCSLTAMCSVSPIHCGVVRSGVIVHFVDAACFTVGMHSKNLDKTSILGPPAPKYIVTTMDKYISNHCAMVKTFKVGQTMVSACL